MAAPENNLHYAGNELIIHDSGDGPDQFYRYVSANDLTNAELLNALRDVVERNGIGYIEPSDTVVRVGAHVGPCKDLFKKFSQHETMTVIVDGGYTKVGQVDMDSQKQRDLIASLHEELVIARGLIKEICTVRSIAEPKASLQRMDKAIKDAKDMLENI